MKRTMWALLAAAAVGLTGCTDNADRRQTTLSKAGVIANDEWKGQLEFRASDKTDGWGRDMKVTVRDNSDGYRVPHYEIVVLSAGADGQFYNSDDIEVKKTHYLPVGFKKKTDQTAVVTDANGLTRAAEPGEKEPPIPEKPSGGK